MAGTDPGEDDEPVRPASKPSNGSSPASIEARYRGTTATFMAMPSKLSAATSGKSWRTCRRSAVHADWVEEIDQFLAEVEVPLSLTDLVFGGSPIPIPEPDDSPSIGRWSPEQIARALEPLRGSLLSKRTTIRGAPSS